MLSEYSFLQFSDTYFVQPLHLGVLLTQKGEGEGERGEGEVGGEGFVQPGCKSLNHFMLHYIWEKMSYPRSSCWLTSQGDNFSTWVKTWNPEIKVKIRQ